MTEQQVFKVAEVYILKTQENILGIEFVFTDNVLNKGGATSVLDYTSQALNSSAWVYNTISRVEEKDAQINTQPESDGGENTKAPPPIEPTTDKPDEDS
jgi:hypothetical protein